MSLEESSHNVNDSEKSTGRARDWESLIAEWEASDLSQRNFCQQHNLSLASFGYYRKKFREAHYQTAAVLPVKVQSSNDRLSATTASLRLLFPNGIQLIAPNERLDELSPLVKQLWALK